MGTTRHQYTPVVVCGISLVLLSILLGVVGESYDIKDGRHNITLGHRKMHPNNTFADHLLFHDVPTMENSYTIFPSVKSHDACYPPKGSKEANFTITAFQVTDLDPENGGYAFVKDGGVGDGHLCLHLKTQRGKGYHFNIDVWGYYN